MGVPLTSRLIGLLNRRLGCPWGEIEVFIDENFQPKYSLSSSCLNGFSNGMRSEMRR